MASSPPQSIDGLFDGACRHVLLWLSAKKVAAVSATSHAWRSAAQAVIEEMHGALVDPAAVACLVSPDIVDDRASAATMDAAVRRLTADLRWLPQVLICFFGRDNSWSDSQAGGPDSSGPGPVVPNTFESCRALLPPGVIVVGCGADGVIGMDCDGRPREMYPEPLHDDEEEEERYFAGASIVAVRSAAAAPPPQLLALSEMHGFGSRRPPSFVAWDGLSLLRNFGMPTSPPVSTVPPPPPSPPGGATAAVSSASRSPKRRRSVSGRKCKLAFGDVLRSWLGRRGGDGGGASARAAEAERNSCERLHFVLTARVRHADTAIEHLNAMSKETTRCATASHRGTAASSVVVGGVVSGSGDLYAGVTPLPSPPMPPISNSSMDDADMVRRGRNSVGGAQPTEGTAEGGERLEHAVEAAIVLLTLFGSSTRAEQQNRAASRSASLASFPPPFSCSDSSSSEAAASSGGNAVRAICIEDGAGPHCYESQCHGALAAAGVWTAETHEKAQQTSPRRRGRHDVGTAGDNDRPSIDQASWPQQHREARRRRRRPRFGLVSACCERGPPFHGAANVEAEVHGRLLPGTILAGFFAGGEIGPPKRDANASEVGEDGEDEDSVLFHSFTTCMGLVS